MRAREHRWEQSGQNRQRDAGEFNHTIKEWLYFSGLLWQSGWTTLDETKSAPCSNNTQRSNPFTYVDYWFHCFDFKERVTFPVQREGSSSLRLDNMDSSVAVWQQSAPHLLCSPSIAPLFAQVVSLLCVCVLPCLVADPLGSHCVLSCVCARARAHLPAGRTPARLPPAALCRPRCISARGCCCVTVTVRRRRGTRARRQSCHHSSSTAAAPADGCTSPK